MTTVARAAFHTGGWLREGRRVVSALLVEAEGSSPLAPGAVMVVDERGSIEDSITGGCVEAAVVGEALEVFAGGDPRLVTYGIADEVAGSVGLTCGGVVTVFVHELRDDIRKLELEAHDAIADGRPVVIATLLDGEGAGEKLVALDGEVRGSLGGPALLDHSVGRDAVGLLVGGRGGIRRYGFDGATLGDDLRVHLNVFGPSPQMVIFGAIDFSAALTRLAKEVGYRVTICDPRRPFLETARFEGAELLALWPQDVFSEIEIGPRDAILLFNHDPKFDLPALEVALRTGAGYIGALGSRRTTAERERRLRAAGVDESSIARIHAPCGLDIGSATPEEVAISVLAEIIATRSGRLGGPLRGGWTSIHSGR